MNYNNNNSVHNLQPTAAADQRYRVGKVVRPVAQFFHGFFFDNASDVLSLVHIGIWEVDMWLDRLVFDNIVDLYVEHAYIERDYIVIVNYLHF